MSPRTTVRRAGPLPSDPPGRAALLDALRSRLSRDPLVALHGDAGSGRTTVARAALGGAGAPLEISFAGCRGAADALRAVGAALDLTPWGDERTILDGLRQRGALAILADDVETSEVYDQLGRLAGSVPGVEVVGVTLTALDGGSFGVDPLPDALIWEAFPGADVPGARGNPLHAALSALLGLPVAALPERLARLVGRWAWWPMGVPGAPPTAVPACLLHPSDHARPRTRLRNGVITLARRGHAALPRPDQAAIEADAVRAALDAVQVLLPLATGAHLRRLPDPRDVLLLLHLVQSPLRAPVTRAADDTGAARLTAAAARLLVAAGQVEVARTLLGAVEGGTGTDRALLGWADGDALLAVGDTDAALVRWREAAEHLRRAGERNQRADLLRRSADRLGARGQVGDAEPLYRMARNAYRALGAPAGVAATLRGAAGLSVASGELVSAATLHEEVELLLAEAHRGDGTREARGDAAREPRPGGTRAPDVLRVDLQTESANLTLSQATLAIAQADHPRGERLLDGLGPLARTDPLLAANLHRRLADLHLRRGDHTAALPAARAAASAYSALGEVVAQAGAERTCGDARLLSGDPAGAQAHYRRALELQVAAQDLHGLRRTLTHLACAAAVWGDPAEAQRRREQADSVAQELEST